MLVDRDVVRTARPRSPHTSGELMFDHVKFGVSDYAASKAFFLKALEPLGVAVVVQWTANAQPGFVEDVIKARSRGARGQEKD